MYFFKISFHAIVFVLAQVFLKIDQRAEMKPEKTWVFCTTPKLWQILKHFIKHKPLIYERLHTSVVSVGLQSEKAAKLLEEQQTKN